MKNVLLEIIRRQFHIPPHKIAANINEGRCQNDCGKSNKQQKTFSFIHLCHPAFCPIPDTRRNTLMHKKLLNCQCYQKQFIRNKAIMLIQRVWLGCISSSFSSHASASGRSGQTTKLTPSILSSNSSALCSILYSISSR